MIYLNVGVDILDNILDHNLKEYDTRQREELEFQAEVLKRQPDEFEALSQKSEAQANFIRRQVGTLRSQEELVLTATPPPPPGVPATMGGGRQQEIRSPNPWNAVTNTRGPQGREDGVVTSDLLEGQDQYPAGTSHGKESLPHYKL
jgi:hypothetical protein